MYMYIYIYSCMYITKYARPGLRYIFSVSTVTDTYHCCILVCVDLSNYAHVLVLLMCMCTHECVRLSICVYIHAYICHMCRIQLMIQYIFVFITYFIWCDDIMCQCMVIVSIK